MYAITYLTRPASRICMYAHTFFKPAEETRDGPTRPLHARPARCAHAAKPRRDGADDPQPRRPGQRPGSARRRILRPARLGRADRDRGDPGLAPGRRLSGHARHPQRGPGRRLAARDRRRARRGRPDLPAALARRPDLASLPAAGRRSAGRAIGDRRRGRRLHGERAAAVRHPARARDRRDPGHRRPVRGRARAMRSRPASMASRSTAPTAI